MPTGVPKSLINTSFPFNYNRLDELEEIVKKYGNDLAAIVMEPIRSDEPQEGFLEGVRAIADKTNAVMIFDEISAGFRMNTGGAHLLYGVNPDIAVFSKALGNGYPIGAIIGKGAIMDAAQNSFISSTMWTERIGPAAAIATIKKHRSLDAGKHLLAIGKSIQQGWKDAAARNNLTISVGGIPPLSHFSFDYENGLSMKAYFVQLMLEKGFLASNQFYSMYAHTQQNIDDYLKAVEDAFREVAEARNNNVFEERMKTRPSTSGFKRLT